MPLRAYVIPCAPSLSRMPDATTHAPGAVETRRFYLVPDALAREELSRSRALRITSGFRRAAGVKRPANPQLVEAITPWISPHALVGDQARAPAAGQQRNHARANAEAELDQPAKPARRALISRGLQQAVLHHRPHPDPDERPQPPRGPRQEQVQRGVGAQ